MNAGGEVTVLLCTARLDIGNEPIELKSGSAEAGRGLGWSSSEMMVFIDASSASTQSRVPRQGPGPGYRQGRYDTGDMRPLRLLRSPTAPGLVMGNIKPVKSLISAVFSYI